MVDTPCPEALPTTGTLWSPPGAAMLRSARYDL
jgi:hypothetical protein